MKKLSLNISDILICFIHILLEPLQIMPSLGNTISDSFLESHLYALVENIQ